MSFKARSREELNTRLKEIRYGERREEENPFACQYALISFEIGKEQLVYFTQLNGMFFESPCELMKTKMQVPREEFIDRTLSIRYCHLDSGTRRLLKEFMEETMDGNYYYGIENPQTIPFIEFPCTVKRILSEREAVDYLRGKENADGEK